MRPIALFELTSVFSFFLKERDIELFNVRYFDFFLKNYEKQKLFDATIGHVKSKFPLEGNGSIISPWKDVSVEEYNFCLSRLSKCLSNKEKICTLILLQDLCYENRLFHVTNIGFLKEAAQMLMVNLNCMMPLRQLLTRSVSELNILGVENRIILIDINVFVKSFHLGYSQTAESSLGFTYIHEEEIIFFRVFEKEANLNGTELESNKLYPMCEGDILTIGNKDIPFNQLFQYYYERTGVAPLKIIASEFTPEVYFNTNSNTLEIKGCSIPENAIDFYKTIIKWLDNFLKTNPFRIQVNIRLDYFNTSSSKCILDLFIRLQTYKKANIDMQINWFFQAEDDDLEEAGINYSDILKIPFTLIPYE